MASEVHSVAMLSWAVGQGFVLLLAPPVTLTTHCFLWILRCHVNIVP